MHLYRLFITTIFVWFVYYNSDAQQITSDPFVKVDGEVTTPLTLNRDALSKMKRTTLSIKDHDGKSVSYTGAPLQEILEIAGVTMGKQLRKENLAKYLLIKCADGYKVLFSLAEIDSSFTNNMIILAYESAGKPLPAETGPFKLVVPADKKLSRSSYQVTNLVIGSAK